MNLMGGGIYQKKVPKGPQRVLSAGKKRTEAGLSPLEGPFRRSSWDTRKP